MYENATRDWWMRRRVSPVQYVVLGTIPIDFTAPGKDSES
jgi:hypothetical protein